MRHIVTHFGPAQRVARRFVAGETLDEAVTVVKDLNRRGIKTILNAALDREPLPEKALDLPDQKHVFARSGNEFFADDDEEEVAA